MSDPRTPYLDLIKPIVGDEAGEDLWGEKLNGNFDKIDQFASEQGSLEEAPLDNKAYVRENAAWTEGVSRLDYTTDWGDQDARDDGQDNQIGALGTQLGMHNSQISDLYAVKVTKAGDTMTGPLDLPATYTGPANAVRKDYVDQAIGLFEPKITAGDPSYFWAGDKTWKPVPAQTDAYTKAESDAKYFPFTGGVITGLTTMQFTSGPVYLRLNKGVNQPAAILGGRTGNIARWAVVLGDENTESGGNSGSDFDIARYNDTGALIDAPITIKRSTGIVDFLQTPTVAGVPIGGGGGSPPGGANTQIQFNDSGVFGGDTALTWNKTTDALTLTGIMGIGIAPNATYPLLVHGETNGNLGITGHSTQVGVQLRALNDALSANAFFEFTATDFRFVTGPVTITNGNASSGPTSGALVVTGAIATSDRVNALRAEIRGSTSGSVLIQALGAVTSYNFNLPLTPGTAGQVLTSQGGGTNAMTWTTPSAGGSFLPLTGGKLTGDLEIEKALPTLTLDIQGTVQAANIFGQRNGLNRWRLSLGNNTNEPGSNVGTDLTIMRWDDAGGSIDEPLQISRATGVVNFSQTPTVAGQPLAGAGPVTEQFFTLDNLGLLDVTVPTWAKACQISGVVRPTTTAALVYLAFSLDGTNIIQSGTSYSNYGPYGNTGTNAFQTFGFQDTTGIWLTVQGDNNAVAHHIDATVDLTRPSNSVSINARVDSRVVDNSAAMGARSMFSQGLMKAAAGTGLKVQKFRIAPGAGNFGPGSYVSIKWLGDSAAVPPVSGVGEAPSDGGEYVRVNGVWRLKAQTLVLDGLTTIDVTVPPAARLGRFDMVFFWANAAAGNSLVWRGSLDGTNFAAGVSDYFYGGMAHYSGSSGFANLAPANLAYGALTFASDSINHPLRVRFLLNLSRPTNSAFFAGIVNGEWYHSPATNLYTDMQFSSGIQGLTGLQLQKLRFYNLNTGGLFGASSTISCEWIY